MMKIKNKTLPVGAVLLFGLLQGVKAAPEPPNIIVLFIDDLGFGDVSSFASTDVITPNIDRLAETGVRFMNGYTTAAICSPSRASTMTGLYPQRFGVYGNNHRGVLIPEDHPTLPQSLRDAGYVTGMVGRMDLGSPRQNVFEIGFDEVAMRRRPPPRDQRVHESGVTYLGRDGSYWTSINGPEIVEFIDRHKDRPFYLYYAPLAVHFPVEEVPQRYLDRVPDTITGQRRYMAGTIIAVDDVIGQLLDKLEAEDLHERTLIFFTSDNGGSLRDGSDNGPLRGGKQTQWDGAYRVPYIVHWPAKFEGGRTLEGLVSTLDIYPTAMAVAGIEPPPGLDGVNLLPFLTGDAVGTPHEALFLRWFDDRAHRWNVSAVWSGPWRWVRFSPDAWADFRVPAEDFVTELYNLEDDPGETTDRAAEFPEIVEDLQARFEAWEQTLAPIQRNFDGGQGIPMPSGEGWSFRETPE